MNGFLPHDFKQRRTGVKCRISTANHKCKRSGRCPANAARNWSCVFKAVSSAGPMVCSPRTTDTSTEPETGDPRDVVTDAEPATVLTYTEGCAANGAVELWTLPEGVHIPAFNAAFSDQIVEFLLANPKA